MKKNLFPQTENESTLTKQCTKFNSFYRFDSDLRVPVVYIHLKSKGVPKKQALNFCGRSLCRNDSTKTKDGPANFRILKVVNEPKPTLNGWQTTRPIYDLGSNFYQSHEDIIKKDDEDASLQAYFQINDKKIKNDFKAKISYLAKYYKELNDQYTFSTLNRKELLDKLKEGKNKTDKKKANPRHFVNYDGLKLYNLGEEIYAENEKHAKKTYIHQMNLLPVIGATNLPISEECYLDTEIDISFHQMPKKKAKQNFDSDGEELDEYDSQELNQNMKSTVDSMKIRDMKKRSTVFFELEAQSNFLKNISSIDQMVNVNSFTPSQSKLLKINSSRTSKNTNGKSGISIGDLDSNFDAKKYGDEFNQSKYVTTLSNSNKGVKSPPFKSNFSSQMKKESISTKIKCEKQRRSSFFLNKFDEDNIDHEVFENNLKKIINTHIEYQNHIGHKKPIDTKHLIDLVNQRKKLKLELSKHSLSSSYFKNQTERILDKKKNSHIFGMTSISSALKKKESEIKLNSEIQEIPKENYETQKYSENRLKSKLKRQIFQKKIENDEKTHRRYLSQI